MHESEKWKWSRSVVSKSSWPRGLQPTRLLHPWDFPGKSTGVGCHWLPMWKSIQIEDGKALKIIHHTNPSIILIIELPHQHHCKGELHHKHTCTILPNKWNTQQKLKTYGHCKSKTQLWNFPLTFGLKIDYLWHSLFLFFFFIIILWFSILNLRMNMEQQPNREQKARLPAAPI